MVIDEFRGLRDVELRILERMMQVPIPQSAVLREQIAAAKVRPLDESGSLEFKLCRSCLPAQAADGPILTALQPDEDTVENFGPYINYILFVKDGLVTELQIYKDDGSQIKKPLDPTKIALAFRSKV